MITRFAPQKIVPFSLLFPKAIQNNMCVSSQFFSEKVRASAKTKHKSEKIHKPRWHGPDYPVVVIVGGQVQKKWPQTVYST